MRTPTVTPKLRQGGSEMGGAMRVGIRIPPCERADRLVETVQRQNHHIRLGRLSHR
jgi:hypothetical protein